MKRIQFPVDKTMNKILDEAEKEFKDKGITRDQIKEAFYVLWYNSKKIIQSTFFPNISFPKWGVFKPKAKQIRNWSYVEPDLELKEQLTNVVKRIENEKIRRKRTNSG